MVDVLKETPVAKALQIVAREGFGGETNPDSTLKVEVASRARTVTAQYERDECLIEMVLSYDPAFPFVSVSVVWIAPGHRREEARTVGPAATSGGRDDHSEASCLRLAQGCRFGV